MSVRIAELTIAAEYAELVALGISECHPAAAIRSAMIGNLRGTQSEQPRHLLIPGCISRSKIKMQPILDLFGFWYLDEQQSGAAVGREDHALWLIQMSQA